MLKHGWFDLDDGLGESLCEFLVGWIQTPLHPGEDRDWQVGHAGHHRPTHLALPPRPGLVQVPALHMDTLSSTEDAEHDLPGGVFVIKLPALGTQTGLRVTTVVTVQLLIKGVA